MDPASRIGKQITADTATYVAADATHPGGYLLEGVRSPVDFATKDSVLDQGRTFLLLPKDQPWLKANSVFYCQQRAVRSLGRRKRLENLCFHLVDDSTSAKRPRYYVPT